MHFSFCDPKARYRDRGTGQYVCLAHARLEVVAAERRPEGPPLTIRCAEPEDYPRIEALAFHFWDETDVDCFDRQYDALACPAIVAADGETIVGVASYAVEADRRALTLVLLHVLPGWQGRGGGRALLKVLRDEVRRQGLECLRVATTNDDLPALDLYQRFGFSIVEVLPGNVARHHGGEVPGLAGIPVRDKVRLVYEVTRASRG